LRAIVDANAAPHETMAEAIRYALLGGGKRIRPLLCLWTHDAFATASGNPPTRDAALDAACALECVHTYSLAHDDLPCMDDDDLRRGQPSLHRRYDEATAILTGDALLALAFEILAGAGAPTGVALEAVRVVARAAGTGGLITGQALDLENTGRDVRDLALVERIHEFKTGRLIAASLEIGALAAWNGSTPTGDARTRVQRAGLLIGSAFQIVDDLLDVQGDAATLGKTPRKDVARGKPTYPAAAGIAASEGTARERIERALDLLPEAAETPLAALVRFVAERRS